MTDDELVDVIRQRDLPCAQGKTPAKSVASELNKMINNVKDKRIEKVQPRTYKYVV